MKPSKQTPKPLLAAQFEAQARRLAGDASDVERRFLVVSLARGKEMAPTGQISGPVA